MTCSRTGPLAGASLVAAEVGMGGVGSAGEQGSCWTVPPSNPHLPLVIEAWSAFRAGSWPGGEGKDERRVLAERTGPGTAESQVSSRTLSVCPSSFVTTNCALQFSSRGIRPGLTTVLARNLDKNTVGYLQWRWGIQSAMNTSIVRDTKTSHFTVALQVGTACAPRQCAATPAHPARPSGAGVHLSLRC